MSCRARGGNIPRGGKHGRILKGKRGEDVQVSQGQGIGGIYETTYSDPAEEELGTGQVAGTWGRVTMGKIVDKVPRRKTQTKAVRIKKRNSRYKGPTRRGRQRQLINGIGESETDGLKGGASSVSRPGREEGVKSPGI